MKLRIKFTKLYSSKYFGHLDLQRIIKIIIRRAEIDVAYSKGFSPHMSISIASPLSLGINSISEYFDIETNYKKLTQNDISDLLNSLNNNTIEGLNFIKATVIEDTSKKNKAMSLVSVCEYIIEFKKFDESINNNLLDFISRENIMYTKTNKKNIVKEINLKDKIYTYQIIEDENILNNLFNSFVVTNSNYGYLYIESKAGNTNLNPYDLVSEFFKEFSYDFDYEIYRISIKDSNKIDLSEIY